MEPAKIKVKAMCVIVRNGNEILAGLGRDEVKGEDFGRIIGGGVEFGETAEAAVRREFQEELGTDLENLEFIKVIENTFTFNGQPGHEIIFMFKGEKALFFCSDKDIFRIVQSAIEAMFFGRMYPVNLAYTLCIGWRSMSQYYRLDEFLQVTRF